MTYSLPLDPDHKPTSATYNCARCGSPHVVQYRPKTFPHLIECRCGNTLTADDAIIRALPEEPWQDFDQYR